VIEKIQIYVTYLSPALFHNVQTPSETINNSSNEAVHTRPEENIPATPVVQDHVKTTYVMTPNKLSNLELRKDSRSANTIPSTSDKRNKPPCKPQLQK
jgi:hypothetical protein